MVLYFSKAACIYLGANRKNGTSFSLVDLQLTVVCNEFASLPQISFTLPPFCVTISAPDLDHVNFSNSTGG
jgi:hypothetical protein